ncbi:uncharacterized protein LOC144767155 [Lissotriton helveticus]
MSGAEGSTGTTSVESDPPRAPSKFAIFPFKELRQLCSMRGIKTGPTPTAGHLRELLDQSEALKNSKPGTSGTGEEVSPSEDDNPDAPAPEEEEEEVEESESDDDRDSQVLVSRLNQANLSLFGTEGGSNPFRPPNGLNQEHRRRRNHSGESNTSHVSKGSHGNSRREFTSPQRREHEAKMREAELRIQRQELEVALAKEKLARARQPRESGLDSTGGSTIPKDKDRSYDNRNLSKIVPPYKVGDDIHKWMTALERACKVQQVPQEQAGYVMLCYTHLYCAQLPQLRGVLAHGRQMCNQYQEHNK